MRTGRAVLILLQGILALLVGTLGLAFGEEPLTKVTTVALLAAFVLSLLGATAVFRCWNLYRVNWAVASLVLASVLVSLYPWPGVIIGPIGIVTALVSFGLVRVGWDEMKVREELRRNPPPNVFPRSPLYPPYPPPPDAEPPGPDLPRGHS